MLFCSFCAWVKYLLLPQLFLFVIANYHQVFVLCGWEMKKATINEYIVVGGSFWLNVVWHWLVEIELRFHNLKIYSTANLFGAKLLVDHVKDMLLNIKSISSLSSAQDTELERDLITSLMQIIWYSWNVLRILSIAFLNITSTASLLKRPSNHFSFWKFLYIFHNYRF